MKKLRIEISFENDLILVQSDLKAEIYKGIDKILSGKSFITIQNYKNFAGHLQLDTLNKEFTP